MRDAVPDFAWVLGSALPFFGAVPAEKPAAFSVRFARLIRLHSGKLDCFAVFGQLPSVEAGSANLTTKASQGFFCQELRLLRQGQRPVFSARVGAEQKKGAPEWVRL